jgi:hypothetical protein
MMTGIRRTNAAMSVSRQHLYSAAALNSSAGHGPLLLWARLRWWETTYRTRHEEVNVPDTPWRSHRSCLAEADDELEPRRQLQDGHRPAMEVQLWYKQRPPWSLKEQHTRGQHTDDRSSSDLQRNLRSVIQLYRVRRRRLFGVPRFLRQPAPGQVRVDDARGPRFHLWWPRSRPQRCVCLFILYLKESCAQWTPGMSGDLFWYSRWRKTTDDGPNVPNHGNTFCFIIRYRLAKVPVRCDGSKL